MTRLLQVANKPKMLSPSPKGGEGETSRTGGTRCSRGSSVPVSGKKKDKGKNSGKGARDSRLQIQRIDQKKRSLSRKDDRRSRALGEATDSVWKSIEGVPRRLPSGIGQNLFGERGKDQSSRTILKNTCIERKKLKKTILSSFLQILLLSGTGWSR